MKRFDLPLSLSIKEAEDEFLSLEASFKAKFIHILELGPFEVGMLHVCSMRDKLWEIRMKTNHGIARSLFIIQLEKRVIILHTFIKKSQKTPKRALDKAKIRMKEIH